MPTVLSSARVLGGACSKLCIVLVVQNRVCVKQLLPCVPTVDVKSSNDYLECDAGCGSLADLVAVLLAGLHLKWQAMLRSRRSCHPAPLLSAHCGIPVQRACWSQDHRAGVNITFRLAWGSSPPGGPGLHMSSVFKKRRTSSFIFLIAPKVRWQGSLTYRTSQILCRSLVCLSRTLKTGSSK